MARVKTILQSEFPYNISLRCINREWFNIDMSRVWQIFCEELSRTSSDHSLLIHSFLLMNNHIHMIASTPQANISKCMHRFVGRSSRRLNLEGNRINENFAGRHYKCILKQNNSFLNAYKYNYRNPVKAGICEKVEDYSYSTLPYILKNSTLPFPLTEMTGLKSDPNGTLSWLNAKPDPEKLEGVRYGLKRQFFKSKKCPKTERLLVDENELL